MLHEFSFAIKLAAADIAIKFWCRLSGVLLEMDGIDMGGHVVFVTKFLKANRAFEVQNLRVTKFVSLQFVFRVKSGAAGCAALSLVIRVRLQMNFERGHGRKSFGTLRAEKVSRLLVVSLDVLAERSFSLEARAAEVAEEIYGRVVQFHVALCVRSGFEAFVACWTFVLWVAGVDLLVPPQLRIRLKKFITSWARVRHFNFPWSSFLRFWL